MGAGASSSQALKSGVLDLLRRRIPADDDIYKNLFAFEGLSSDDFYTEFDPRNAVNIVTNQPKNAEIIALKAMEIIIACSNTPDMPSRSDATALLNALRCATRLFPVLYAEHDGFYSSTWSALDTDSHGELFMKALVKLCFKPGFSIPAQLSENGENSYIWYSGLVGRQNHRQFTTGARTPDKDQYQEGNFAEMMPTSLFSIKPIPVSSFPILESNRVELLRCFLAVLTDILFIPQHALPHTLVPSHIHTDAILHQIMPYTQRLFLSLLNCAATFSPSSSLPYGYLLESNNRGDLAQISLMTLVALIAIDPLNADLDVDIGGGGRRGNGREVDKGKGDAEAEANAAGTGTGTKGKTLAMSLTHTPKTALSLMATLCGSIYTYSDMSILYSGIARVLCLELERENTYLPGSAVGCAAYRETLVLLWQCLVYIPSFLDHIGKNEDANRIIEAVCVHLLNNRYDPTNAGLCHIGSHILLILSSSFDVAAQLNKAYTAKYKVDTAPIYGSYADFLYAVIHRFVLDDRVSGLVIPLVTVLANVSPYVKATSKTTSTKLLNMFELFAAPQYVYSSPHSHQLSALMLEIMNNAIQYQLSGNVHLVYGILRRWHVFHELILAPEGVDMGAAAADALGKKRGRTIESRVGYLPGRNEEEKEKEEKEEEKAEPESEKTADNGKEKEKEEEEEEEDYAAGVGSSSGANPNHHYAERGIPPPPSYPRPPPVPPRQSLPTPVHISDSYIRKWKAKLPCLTILRLIEILLPKLRAIIASNTDDVEAEMMEYLDNTTLVGRLPIPHPILVRKYNPNTEIKGWIVAYLWTLAFNQLEELPLAILNSLPIQLFSLGVEVMDDE